MSLRTDALQAAGMQFPDGVLPAMENLLETLDDTAFNNLVAYTKGLSNQPPPNNNVALAYIAFQFRAGKQ